MNKNSRNNFNVKYSIDCYRNIKGVRYEHYTSNPDEFAEVKQVAKELGLKIRTIKGELFREVKDLTK